MSPRINIQFGNFLDPAFQKAFLVDHPEHIPLTDEELFERIKRMREG